MNWRIEVGDCRDALRSMPAGSVHTVVTSPPYFGLRDYGTGEWEGGDSACDHLMLVEATASGRVGDNGRDRAASGGTFHGGPAAQKQRQFATSCGKCGARRVDRQIGLEPTPDEFVAALVDVFDEVWRVMRDDATAWINLGDSYGPDGQLLGVPWRFAFAMQERGWRLRSDIVWSKLPMPNPMPESVTNRPTKAHEMLFLFAKGRRRAGQFANISEADARWLALLFDTEGNIVIKRAQNGERLQYGAQVAFANTSRPLLERARAIVGAGSIHERPGRNAPLYYWQMSGREARDLLSRIYPFLIVKQRQARVAVHMQNEIARPKKRPGRYRTSEHASFLERCWLTVKALNQFGDPDLSWVPEPDLFLLSKGPRYFYDADAVREQDSGQDHARAVLDGQASLEPSNGIRGAHNGIRTLDGRNGAGRNKRSVWTVATQPYAGAHFATFPPKLTEPCILAGCPEGGLVLDPFAGAGTTGLVALQHGREFVGIELNPDYAAMARERIETAVRLGFRPPQNGAVVHIDQAALFNL